MASMLFALALFGSVAGLFITHALCLGQMPGLLDFHRLLNQNTTAKSDLAEHNPSHQTGLWWFGPGWLVLQGCTRTSVMSGASKATSNLAL